MDMKDQDTDELRERMLDMEGFSEEQAAELGGITRRFLASYAGKPEDMNDRDWLERQLKEELPSLGGDEAAQLAGQCMEEIESFSQRLSSLDETIENGGTKEQWFAKKVQEASVGVSINEFGAYLSTVDRFIYESNLQMKRVITNRDGGISQSLNLDGFMAEQHHVNSFNMNAKLQRSPFMAEVMAPAPGQTYGKNSFDVVIRDSGGNIVHQYQMKYGATAQDTIRLIRSGNYNNQRLVVPAEQLAEVKKAFPGKSIDSSIGQTDKVQTASQPLTKPQAKEMQRTAQARGEAARENWNHFQTKELAKHIGKQAGIAGIQAAALTAGLDITCKMMRGESIAPGATIELALQTGADAGIKAAAAGAVFAGVEKGVIPLIPKGTPIGVIANIVSVGIENVKIAGQVTAGQLTASQGLDRMGRTTTSMVYGIGWGSAGATIGAAALSWIPVAGPIIGGFVGGMVAYTAGSKFGEAVYETAKKIAITAKKAAFKAWESLKGTGNRVLNWLTSH
ncbi:hypothetical protein [Paenibacillus sp. y28]|uniref:hypothetical protein n=1 Tax=Paenibacillus sp. y28 TaxID=3129110 RepID=UPI00301672DD